MKKLMVSAIFIILITLLFPQLSVYADNADNEPIQGITQTTDEPVYIDDRCYPLTANKEEKMTRTEYFMPLNSPPIVEEQETFMLLWTATFLISSLIFCG